MSEDPYAFKNSNEMGDLVPQAPRTYARFAELDENGKVISIAPPSIPLDVWRYVRDLVTGEQTSFSKRERMRSLLEVYGDLSRALDIFVCKECNLERSRRHELDEKGCQDWGQEPCSNCGGELESFIDEYFSGPDDYSPGCEKLVPYDWHWIACFPVTGGSEGHYIHVEFHCEKGDFERPVPGQLNVRRVRLALGKTFRGMNHAAEIARRCAILLGA